MTTVRRWLRAVLGGMPMLATARHAAPLVVLTLAACSTAGGTATGHGTSGPQSSRSAATRLAVTSTLDGHASLPLRIHWQAFPSAPAADVSEVDFLIDGKLGWVEHVTPYFYGNDGNWLVTSFLSPGEHVFTVRAIDTDGTTATDTVPASVAAASAPPSVLSAGTWTRVVTPADVLKSTSGQPPPPGRWLLTVSSVGWQLHDPNAGGLLFDVSYDARTRLQMRPTIDYPPYPNANSGGFCEDTDRLWTWTYSTANSGTTLTLNPLGHDPCGDRAAILAGTWKRTGK